MSFETTTGFGHQLVLDRWYTDGTPFQTDGRPQVERVEKSSLSGDSLVDLVHVVLQNAVIAGESEELGQVRDSI